MNHKSYIPYDENSMDGSDYFQLFEGNSEINFVEKEYMQDEDIQDYLKEYHLEDWAVEFTKE